MATRNLKTNSRRTKRELKKRLTRFYGRELRETYKKAYADIREAVTRLLTVDPADLTRAQRTQLLRNSNLLLEINRVLDTPIRETQAFLETLSKATVEGSFLRAAWSVEQASGVALKWGLLNDNAVRVAAGLSGDSTAMQGIMSRSEIARHNQVLSRAFRNYGADTRKWIGRTVSDGIVKGESIPQVTKRIQEGLNKSRRSAETIARTETGRAMTTGSQMAYDQAEDEGVRINQVWDATLDMRTRPDHAEMDGRIRDEETGMFPAPWGASPGPKRNGIAAQDINCRCDVTPEVEGYAPELRRIRDEGLVPTKRFTEWAKESGITRNDYGQKYDFLIPVEL